MKSYGLTTKNMIDKSKIIIFGCKIFPFILNKEKKNYINDLFELQKNQILIMKNSLNILKDHG